MRWVWWKRRRRKLQLLLQECMGMCVNWSLALLICWGGNVEWFVKSFLILCQWLKLRFLVGR
jgi:hypothetical protein